MASTAPCTSAYPVTRITGSSGSRSLAWRINSMPSMPGILRSRRRDRAGDRSQAANRRNAQILRADSSTRYRPFSVRLDVPALPLRLHARLPGGDVPADAEEQGQMEVTPAGEILAVEIGRAGPVSFSRFMEVALYHPQHGYYRRRRDPFGKQGDFYTAEQLQPVFGLLMAARTRQLCRAAGVAADPTVVELGAGRGEMADAFAPWRYIPIEIGEGKLPEHWSGVLFSNEFFDALPVEVVLFRGGEFRE